MDTGRLMIRNTPLVLFLVLLIGCTPPPSATTPQTSVEVKNITESNVTVGEISQSKTFDQCDAPLSLKVQIQFSDSASETNQQELVLSAGVSGEAGVSAAAKVKVEGSIQEHFSSSKSAGTGHFEGLDFEIPAHTRQQYTIVWNEVRREGTVEYTENGETKFANYSYRVGLELSSSSVKNIDCSLPTDIPPPATASVELPASLPARTLADGCIFSQTWKPDSIDQNTLDSLQTDLSGCYSMEALGIFADPQGVLHIYKRDKKTPQASGIYTPINKNSVIEFNIYVNLMYIVYAETPAYVSFAVAPASDPMSARNAARFNLQVQVADNNPAVLFALADAGESSAVPLGTQHYEYTRTYTVRFELTGGLMDVYINNLKLNESLAIPDESKVFYIGYSLPVLAGADVKIRDIRIDGVLK